LIDCSEDRVASLDDRIFEPTDRLRIRETAAFCNGLNSFLTGDVESEKQDPLSDEKREGEQHARDTACHQGTFLRVVDLHEVDPDDRADGDYDENKARK
jgi:hypothetical protein